MQTDLKMQNEINSEDGLNLFWDGGLWCSAKLTVSSKHLLWSFNNTVLGGRASPLFEKKIKKYTFSNKKNLWWNKNIRLADLTEASKFMIGPFRPYIISGKPQNDYLYKTALSWRRLLRFHQPGDVVYAQKMECFSYQGS